MDGMAFQHLDDGAFEQTDVRPCNNVTRAAVEDEQQWGLEQCGCRQETEVGLARKSIGFLPTITSNSSSNGREQFLQREHNLNFNSRGGSSSLQLYKLQGGRSSYQRCRFLSVFSGTAALSCNEIHIQEKMLFVHHTNATSAAVCGENWTTFIFELRASFLMKTPPCSFTFLFCTSNASFPNAKNH